MKNIVDIIGVKEGEIMARRRRRKQPKIPKIPGMKTENGAGGVLPSSVNQSLWSPKNFKNIKDSRSFKTKVKKIVSYDSKMPGYRYKNQRQPREGDEIPANQSRTAPNGMQWKTQKPEEIKHTVMDYEESDIFSNFDGDFFLEKIGNKYHCWINVDSSSPIDANGQPDSHSISHRKICESWFTDEDKSKSFALSSIAVQFVKHNLLEDHPPRGYDHVYHDIDAGCGAVEYWNIFDGGYDDGKPHIIAHKGETIVIDTSRLTVKKTNGQDLTKYTSFASDFPPLYGGIINDIDFYPTVGDKCDVDILYIPRIK